MPRCVRWCGRAGITSLAMRHLAVAWRATGERQEGLVRVPNGAKLSEDDPANQLSRAPTVESKKRVYRGKVRV